MAVAALAALLAPTAEAQAKVDQLQYLFDRPSEPIFLPKESDKGSKSVFFDVPNEYLVCVRHQWPTFFLCLVRTRCSFSLAPDQTDRQKKLGAQVINRFGEKAEHVTVRKINLPDLSVPGQLDRRAQFSLFLPEHRKLAGRLIDVFMGKSAGWVAYAATDGGAMRRDALEGVLAFRPRRHRSRTARSD